MASPQPKHVDVRQKYPDGEQRRKVLVTMRPYSGIVDKDGVFKEDASGMDALIVLVRAMTAYGWKPSGNLSVVEAALHKTALMDLGWDAQADRIAKRELAAILGEEISVDMFCSEQLEGFAMDVGETRNEKMYYNLRGWDKVDAEGDGRYICFKVNTV
jgi:hypothetical protein